MNQNVAQQVATEAGATSRAKRRVSQLGPDTWTDADREIRTFVAERPFVAVGLALAAGYLIGRAINAAR